LCIPLGLDKILGHFIPVSSYFKLKEIPSSVFIVRIVFDTNKGNVDLWCLYWAQRKRWVYRNFLWCSFPLNEWFRCGIWNRIVTCKF